MSRAAIFFLMVVTLGLSILLSWLGWITLPTNLLGWFLLLTGSIYFIGVIIVYWMRGIRFWRPRAPGEVIQEERDDWSFWFIVVGMIAAFYLPPFEYLYFPPLLKRHVWMQLTGLMIVFMGSILFVWARRALGNFYSGHLSVIEGQPLVQRGPYRFVRHPAYGGYVLIALGLALGYSSLLGIAAINVLLMPAVVYRIHIEDKLLAGRFGAQFDNYARRTKRLFPYIW